MGDKVGQRGSRSPSLSVGQLHMLSSNASMSPRSMPLAAACNEAFKVCSFEKRPLSALSDFRFSAVRH